MKTAIVIRGALYVALAAIPIWIAFFSGIVDSLLANKTPLQHWAVWALVTLNSIYQSLLALRAYIDGSAERAKQPPAVTTTPS